MAVRADVRAHDGEVRALDGADLAAVAEDAEQRHARDAVRRGERAARVDVHGGAQHVGVALRDAAEAHERIARGLGPVGPVRDRQQPARALRLLRQRPVRARVRHDYHRLVHHRDCERVVGPEKHTHTHADKDKKQTKRRQSL